MIEVKRDQVRLSFIQGTRVPEFANRLVGTAKHKRYIVIPTRQFARRRDVKKLIRAFASSTAPA